MGKLRHTRCVAAALAAICLSLAGCNSLEIEPTNLSAISIGGARESIDALLGPPVAVEKGGGFLLTAYFYNQGHRSPYQFPWPNFEPATGIIFIDLPAMIVINTKDYSSKYRSAKTLQLGIIVAVFDINQKLVYAGSLSDADLDLPLKLRDISATYAAAQAGKANALRALGEIALFLQQKEELMKRAVAVANPKTRRSENLRVSPN